MYITPPRCCQIRNNRTAVDLSVNKNTVKWYYKFQL